MSTNTLCRQRSSARPPKLAAGDRGWAASDGRAGTLVVQYSERVKSVKLEVRDEAAASTFGLRLSSVPPRESSSRFTRAARLGSEARRLLLKQGH
jgi:hypothetical protein